MCVYDVVGGVVFFIFFSFLVFDIKKMKMRAGSKMPRHHISLYLYIYEIS